MCLWDRVSIINGVVGSGKSELLTAIATLFLLHPRDDVSLFLVAPTRRMVQDLHAAIARHGVDMTLVACHIGVSNPGELAWDPDYFVAAHVADVGHYHQDIVAAIDNAIKMREGAWTPPPDLATYQRLLALRHEHLDWVLYSKAATLGPRPRVSLSTISSLQKLLGTPGLPQHLVGAEHRLLLVDNYHQCSMHSLMAAIAPFDCVVLAGDHVRAPPTTSWLAHPGPVLPEPRGPSSSTDEHANQAALCNVLATQWSLSQGHTRACHLGQTYHMGRSVVSCLQAMAPNKWTGMTSARATDTFIFPFIFSWVSDGAGTHGCPEMSHSEVVFVHAALTIALELLWGDEQPVLCLAFFPGLLDDFRHWLRFCLRNALTAVGACCNWPVP